MKTDKNKHTLNSIAFKTAVLQFTFICTYTQTSCNKYIFKEKNFTICAFDNPAEARRFYSNTRE